MSESSALPAGFGHFDLFDSAAFGNAEVEALLSRFPAFESHPVEGEKDQIRIRLREMGKAEAEWKQRRKKTRQLERQRLEMEDDNAAMRRIIQRNTELVCTHHTPHKPLTTSRRHPPHIVPPSLSSTRHVVPMAAPTADVTRSLVVLCLSCAVSVNAAYSWTSAEHTRSSSHKRRERKGTRCSHKCTSVRLTTQKRHPLLLVHSASHICVNA